MRRRWPVAAAAACLLAGAGCVRALREPPPLVDPGHPSTFRPWEVEALLKQADVLYASRVPAKVREAADTYLTAARADSTRVEGLVGTIRAQAWLIDHEADADTRRRGALAAVQAAQWCGRIAPESAECAYWLGAALGLQARERRSTGLDALPKIEEAFKRAAAARPALESGGPDRALALLYLRAPGWPTGPGDPDLGLEHARKAIAIVPDYPPNLLALAEALAATGDEAGARRTRERAMELARAKAESGDPDAADWILEADEALGGAAQPHQ
jgi:tetratricopeptide (TPR) repeat protein